MTTASESGAARLFDSALTLVFLLMRFTPQETLLLRAAAHLGLARLRFKAAGFSKLRTRASNLHQSDAMAA